MRYTAIGLLLLTLFFGAPNSALALDTTPNPFTFTDVVGAAISTVQTSNTITVSGITDPASISVTGGEYQVGIAAWTSLTSTVVNSDTVHVRHTSAAVNNFNTNTILTIGGVSDTFTSTTIDTVPNSFTFTDVTNATLSTVQTSNTITVSGITGPTIISIAGGEYSKNAAAFTTAGDTVIAGDTVTVRHTSSAINATVVSTVLTIGGVSDTFTSTTISADTTPDPFTFVDVTTAPLSTLQTSNSITVNGITSPAAISIIGGEYALNGSGIWTSSAGTVTNGNTVTVRHTSSATNATAVNTVLTIGGISDTFTSTTIPADTTPDPFTFTDVTNVPISTLQTSNSITVNGITSPAAISIIGGEYALNGSGVWTSSAGTVTNGNTVTVRHTSSATNLTAVNTVLTIGGISDTFTSTTIPVDTTPDPFTFTDVTNVPFSVPQVSNVITVSGITGPTAISIVGGEYALNSSSVWTIAAGTVTNGNTVSVRHTSSAVSTTAVNTTLTIGGISDTFTSTTVDITPDSFTFTDVIGVALSTLQISNAITVSGITAPTAVSVADGEYSKNATAFTAVGGTVIAGDTVSVRHMSSAVNDTAVNTVLTIGGISDTFTSTTLIDTIPNPFTFIDVTNVPFNTLQTSNSIAVSDIAGPALISVAGGEYEKNGSGLWTSSPGTVTNGNTVSVRHTSSGADITEVNTTLTIEGISDTFTSRTQKAAISFALVVTKTGTGVGTITSYPSGINCGSACEASFPSGPIITLTATPDPGSAFAGWEGDCSGSNISCPLTMITLKNVRAIFTSIIEPLTIPVTDLPVGEKAVAYTYVLQASGGTPPYIWSLDRGKKNKLPGDLTLDKNGTLDGIPTKAKTKTFIVKVTDAAGTSITKKLSLEIVQAVKIKTNLSKGKVGIPYLVTLEATGGIAPLVFVHIAGTLPPGLIFDSAAAHISGTPTISGTFKFQVMVVSRSGGSNQEDMKIKIKKGQIVTPPINWPTISLTPVANGFNLPNLVTNAKDGSNRLFIVEQGGKIFIYKNNAKNRIPFLDITERVTSGSERGLLSLAFPPGYASTQHFYVLYTDLAGALTISRFGLTADNSDIANAESEQIVLSIPHGSTTNNGGTLAFGPDGYLYVSLGDDEEKDDTHSHAQNLNIMLGKILRLDVEAGTPITYTIPPSNPFVGVVNQAEIWAYGLHNPWRYSFDRLTGDMYLGDIGQDAWEEVNFQPAGFAGGANYGWHVLEAGHCLTPSLGCTLPAAYVPPVVEYSHGKDDSFGCSVVGGYVYRGTQYHNMVGTYFYGDYCSGRIFAMQKVNGSWITKELMMVPHAISSFGEDEEGNIYVVDPDGTIFQIVSPS